MSSSSELSEIEDVHKVGKTLKCNHRNKNGDRKGKRGQLRIDESFKCKPNKEDARVKNDRSAKTQTNDESGTCNATKLEAK